MDHQLLSNNKRRKSTWELAVTQVMGPVIDVRFEHNEVPEINNALHIEVPKEDGTLQLTLEVALQLGDDVVRTLQWTQRTAFKEEWKLKIQVETLVYLSVT